MKWSIYKLDRDTIRNRTSASGLKKKENNSATERAIIRNDKTCGDSNGSINNMLNGFTIVVGSESGARNFIFY